MLTISGLYISSSVSHHIYLFFRVCTTLSISSVLTNGAWILIGCLVLGSMYSISHFPSNASAHFLPSIVLLSISDTTPNAILVGIFALISHVMTFTEGLWVATIRCIHTARAFCATRVIAVSTSLLCHPNIISANSSITKTIRNIFSQIIF